MTNNPPAKGKSGPVGLSQSMDRFYVYLYKFFWLVILLVCGVILFFGYQWFLGPKYSAVVSNQGIIDKQQDTISKNQYYNQIVALKKLYEKISPENKQKIEQIVTADNDQNELYREAEYIVKKNGLTVESIEPSSLDASYDLPNISGASRQGGLLNRLTLTMTVCKLSKVNYEALVRVLKTFELNLRLMDVQKVEYNPAQQTAAIHFITYQF